MPKKKKTRKLKKLADMRRQINLPRQEISISEKKSFAIEETKTAVPVIKQQPIIAHAISTNDYHYLSTDLFKTAIVTGIIISIELLLNFLTKGFS